MYQKDFDDWNEVKKRINNDVTKSHIRAGEVRWASLGVNVGSEIDGKGTGRYNRPVLILDTMGAHLALVIPLSTSIKKRAGYKQISLNEREVSLCIGQLKSISTNRIFDRVSKLSNDRLSEVKKMTKDFWHL